MHEQFKREQTDLETEVERYKKLETRDIEDDTHTHTHNYSAHFMCNGETETRRRVSSTELKKMIRKCKK